MLVNGFPVTNPRSLVSGENLGVQFQWFVLAALAFLLLDTFLQTKRRSRRAVAAAATTATMLLLTTTSCRRQERDKPGIVLYNTGTTLLLHDSLAQAIEVRENGCVRFGTTASAMILDDWKTHLEQLASGAAAEG